MSVLSGDVNEGFCDARRAKRNSASLSSAMTFDGEEPEDVDQTLLQPLRQIAMELWMKARESFSTSVKAEGDSRN